MTDTTVDAEAAGHKFLSMVGADAATYVEACLRCGQCAQACHFYEASKDPKHTPAYKLFPIAKAYRRAKSPLSLFGLARGPSETELKEWEELIYDSCTMCGRCTQVCPMGIDISTLVAQARTAYAAAGLGPDDLMQAAENVREKGSPIGLTSEVLEDRVDWLADDYDTDIHLDKETADVLVTVSSIEGMKYPASLAAMAKLLNAAGVDWTFSSKGYEATNFGFLSGKTDVAKLSLERIVTAAKSLGAKTVVIPECGHAYGVMRWSAANILGEPLPFEVFHITEYLAGLYKDGKLKFKPMAGSVTYHDPCQISRRGGATDASRELLKAFAEDFREMSPTAEYNWCCGGGGGVQAIARTAELRNKVFKIKMNQVEDTGADTLISACANCRLTMDESIQHFKWSKKLESLVELLADHLEDGED